MPPPLPVPALILAAFLPSFGLAATLCGACTVAALAVDKIVNREVSRTVPRWAQRSGHLAQFASASIAFFGSLLFLILLKTSHAIDPPHAFWFVLIMFLSGSLASRALVGLGYDRAWAWVIRGEDRIRAFCHRAHLTLCALATLYALFA